MSIAAAPGIPPSNGGRWHAVGVTADGQFVSLTVSALDATPSGSTLMDAAAGVADINVDRVFATADDHLRRPPADGSIPGIDAITDWAGSTEFAELRGLPGRVASIPLPGGVTGLAYLPFDGGPGCAAWHDQSCAAVAVPPDLNEVLVSYREDLGAALRRESAASFLASRAKAGTIVTPGHGDVAATDWDTDLEWFAFLGTGTDALHGSDPLISNTGDRGSGTVRFETERRPGLLLVRLLQWLGKPLETSRNDPTFLDRLAAHLNRLGPLADQHPELGDAAEGSLDGPLVWVHGTVSCGLAAVPQLQMLGGPWYRYEHDTFRDIDENGEALADLLGAKLAPAATCVTVLAHSRGGLVARSAAGRLLSARRGLTVQVLTLGTPHRGTPIVNAGHRALKGLVAATTFGGGALPHPGTMLLKYLLRPVALPNGIKDMGTGSRFLAGFNSMPGDAFTLESFGSDYQRGTATETTGVKALARLRPLFEAAGTPANDLVVPLASATARGNGHALRYSRTHFAYLEDPDVKAAVRSAISHMNRIRFSAMHAGHPGLPPSDPPLLEQAQDVPMEQAQDVPMEQAQDVPVELPEDVPMELPEAVRELYESIRRQPNPPLMYRPRHQTRHGGEDRQQPQPGTDPGPT